MESVFDSPDDLYHDTFTSEKTRDADVISSSLGHYMLLGFCILGLRIGFFLLEAGWVPVHDVQLLMLQNIVELLAGSLAFIFLGYGIAFGRDSMHTIGSGGWGLLSGHGDVALAVRGWVAVVISGAVLTAATAGRLPLAGAALAAALLGGVVLPLVMHWAWSPQGWQALWLDFVDEGGSCVVHACAGAAGGAALVVLGGRIMRLKHLDARSITAASPLSTAVGYLLIAVGLAACSSSARGHHAGNETTEPSFMITNWVAAFSAAVLTATVIYYYFSESHHCVDTWVARAMQAGVGGCVVVAACPHSYIPGWASLAGALCGSLVALVCCLWDASGIQDTTCSVPVHLLSGLLGPLLLPILAPRALAPRTNAVRIVSLMGSQALCVLLNATVAFSAGLLIFYLLQVLGLLRNKWEVLDHRRHASICMLFRMNAGKRQPFCSRLFLRYGGFSLKPGVQLPS